MRFSQISAGPAMRHDGIRPVALEPDGDPKRGRMCDEMGRRSFVHGRDLLQNICHETPFFEKDDQESTEAVSIV